MSAKEGRSRYRAHIDLARRFGSRSLFPVRHDMTLFVALPDVDGRADVLEVPVEIRAEVPVIPLSQADELGTASWRNYGSSMYRGGGSPFFAARHFLSKGARPMVFRAISEYETHFEGIRANSPHQLAESLAEHVSRGLPDHLAKSGLSASRDLRVSARDFATATAVRRLETAAVLVGENEHDISIALPAALPHYRVADQGRLAHDPARCDVIVSRDFDMEEADWNDLGLRFEYWETAAAQAALDSMGRSYPVRGIDFDPELARAAAVYNRYEMSGLPGLFAKRVMLDISGSDDAGLKHAASAVYSEVSHGNWGSDRLAAALDALDDNWLAGGEARAVSSKQGWTPGVSPFSLLQMRAAAFPWQGGDPAPREGAAAPSP